MLSQPEWYRRTEQWLLREGAVAISLLLLLVIAISAFFLYSINVRKHGALPAAAWLTYLFMP